MIKEFTLKYLNDLHETLRGCDLEKVEGIINSLLVAYEEEKQIFIMGNGGSGSTASHFACDMNKGVSLGLEKRFKVMSLCDNIPTMLAYANDCSYDDIFVEQLKNFLNPGDIVIGISGSGNSKNVVRAIQYANERGVTTIAWSGFDGGVIAKIAKSSFVAPVHDMQKVEDVHLILTHIIMQILHKKLR
ncbi:MAG: SIS domain-containing protein [Candidatus Scalindua sp. AMX11]|nr:MAG: SIS domain-containing protein [Candidatus Scalindua sp.]NOG83747.1 SIS domain-containing protein [Planctomycetota bacterium]RZV82906.1 MAG: SIS domain-containing protein [Candidatus Scalindua sp. SCAELEC01]TDE64472.1 MAG: SIS domain-containing protein [Candidatus Scalindua sp. AMX11]GJQ59801.1 MAG: phosphoheptose isomerase [Candidatus Scalindua sp.]